MPLGSIHEIMPLGGLFPPAHTTPAAHIYFFFVASGQINNTLVPLVAPGDITIGEVLKQTRSGGGQPTLVDYTVTFFPCATLRMYFAHVTSLEATLAERIGSLDINCGATGSTGGFSYQVCGRATNIPVTAGTPLGMVSGPTQGALDFGAADRSRPPLAFANPSRPNAMGGPEYANYTVCAVDYFAAAVRDALRSLFGRGPRRTVEPVCGEVMQDVPGTAQGRWYLGSTLQEDKALALVHDNVNPSIAAFSVGTAVPTLATRVYRFTPATSGRLNADFHRVTADGNLYCYDAVDAPNQVILIQLVSHTRLRIEGKPGADCAAESTWTFSSGAVEYIR